jgi:protoporphyrinogen/coproporphyrinogen III oxidase
LLRAFLGGARAESDEQLLRMCLEDLKRLMGVDAGPLFHRVYRWPDSLAQYGVGHREHVAAIRHRLAELPGVHVIGNAFDGVGIPDCIKLARSTAGLIAKGA